MRTTPKLPSYKPAVDRNEREEGKREALSEGSQARIEAQALPPIYRQGEQEQEAEGEGQGSALMAAFRKLGDTGLHKLAKQVNRPESRPVFNEVGPAAFWKPSSTAATYVPESRAEVNRRDYGDYRPWSTSVARMTPDTGRRIEFADAPFNAAVRYDPTATSIDPEMHRQMLYWMDATRLNEGNPMFHRLEAYVYRDYQLEA